MSFKVFAVVVPEPFTEESSDSPHHEHRVERIGWALDYGYEYIEIFVSNGVTGELFCVYYCFICHLFVRVAVRMATERERWFTSISGSIGKS